DDYDDDDRPRRSRRRDDDDDDDRPRSRRGRRDEEYDEDDDRPRRGSRRRRDEGDDYDDYDDADRGDPDRRKKARAKQRRRAWQKTGTGVFLGFISMCIYTGAWGVGLLIYLMSFIMLVSGGVGMAGFVGILGYLCMGLSVVSWILFIVGCGFTVVCPGKNGEMGLGITSLSLGAVTLMFFLYLLLAAALGFVASSFRRMGMVSLFLF